MLTTGSMNIAPSHDLPAATWLGMRVTSLFYGMAWPHVMSNTHTGKSTTS